MVTTAAMYEHVPSHAGLDLKMVDDRMAKAGAVPSIVSENPEY